MPKVRQAELWTTKIADRDNKAQNKLQADSHHMHLFNIRVAVTVQTSGS